MITVLESHPSSHVPLPSPLPLTLTTPTHSSSLLRSSHHSPLPFLITPLGLFTPLPPHPTTHHYSPSLHPLITPLTTPQHPFSPPFLTPTSPTLLTTPPHYPLHHSPRYLPSLPHLLTTLFITPILTTPSAPSPHPLTPTPSPLLPRPHHSLKGHNNTKELVKGHLTMSLNLCRTFLSLKTSFLIIFCKKNWDKIDQKLEYDSGGGARVLNCARAMSSIHFSTCNILPLKKTLISHFQVLLVKNLFCCYFSHVPRDNKSHLQKE